MRSRYRHPQRGAMLRRITALAAAAAILPGLNLYSQCAPSTNDNIGCFTSVDPNGRNQLLNFPTATHTFQMLAKSNVTRYTGTNNFIGTVNDFTGYIGKVHGPGNRSSMDGYLGINHETTPGGMSMLRLYMDGTSALWVVSNVKKIDYSGVVQSTRNCSGGITPWGTIISSEESFGTADLNSDGYADVGWNTEIDPELGIIRDFDGNGQPEKLWAMGRMSHENVAVASDSVTVYQAEDGGTNCVYKFIASTPGNLNAGTLYVLKRDNPTSTTGTWVQVPNSTQTQRNTTPSLAAGLGGTNWNGPEDVEIGPDGKIYFAAKGTGIIWRFNDNGTTISNLEVYVGPAARNYTIQTSTGGVSENWGSGIDNLAFDGEGNLWALQDGGEDHIWVIRTGHNNNPATPALAKVELFATTPNGAEPTGITFSPNYRYLFISMQEPSSSNTATQTDVAGNTFPWNASTTLVIARREFMGPLFTNDNRLPVELSGFNLRENDGVVSLSWQTASEVDNAGFEVERADGADGEFRRIISYLNDPSLKGLGTSSTGRSYRYTDDGGLKPGRYRYRLIDVSTDGIRTVHTEHSVEIETAITSHTSSSFSMSNIVPNPAAEQITIGFHLPQETTLTVELFDAAGRRIGSVMQDRAFATGSHQVDVNIEGLAPGTYFVTSTTPVGTRTREFVVAR